MSWRMSYASGRRKMSGPLPGVSVQVQGENKYVADAMVWKWGLRHYSMRPLYATYPEHWQKKSSMRSERCSWRTNDCTETIGSRVRGNVHKLTAIPSTSLVCTANLSALSLQKLLHPRNYVSTVKPVLLHDFGVLEPSFRTVHRDNVSFRANPLCPAQARTCFHC